MCMTFTGSPRRRAAQAVSDAVLQPCLVTDEHAGGRLQQRASVAFPVAGGETLSYALTGPDGRPLVTTPLTDKQAVDLADLRSMASDLEQVVRYCDAFQRLSEDEHAELRQAVAEAAVITYGRCHTSGRSSAHRRARRILPKALIDGLPTQLQEKHELYKELRNREVGHRAGAGEDCRVLAVHDQPGGPVVQIATVMVSFPVAMVDGLRELAAELLTRVEGLRAQEEATLLARLMERGVN
jgi:hypothetical protein